MRKNFVNAIEIRRAIQWQPSDNESIILLKEEAGFLLAYFKGDQYQTASFKVDDAGQAKVIDHEGFMEDGFVFDDFYASIQALTEKCEGELV